MLFHSTLDTIENYRIMRENKVILIVCIVKQKNNLFYVIKKNYTLNVYRCTQKIFNFNFKILLSQVEVIFVKDIRRVGKVH